MMTAAFRVQLLFNNIEDIIEDVDECDDHSCRGY